MKITKEEKEQILQLWNTGNKSITEISFILGINVPDVRAITDADYRKFRARVEAN